MLILRKHANMKYHLQFRLGSHKLINIYHHQNFHFIAIFIIKEPFNNNFYYKHGLLKIFFLHYFIFLYLIKK